LQRKKDKLEKKTPKEDDVKASNADKEPNIAAGTATTSSKANA
jgi:hypothetical protein